MADINWGILQPGESLAPIRAASPQAQSSGVPVASTPNPSAGIPSMTEQQQLGIEKQRLKMEQAKQPGILEQQKLQNQGLILDNQEKQAAADSAQYQIKLRQGSSQAFMNGKAKGGNEVGLDSMQDFLMEQGDAQGALKLAQTREELNKAKSDSGVAGIAAIGNMAASVATSAKQTGQSELDVYTKIYPTVQKIYPGAPKPDSFKSNGEFHDSFMTPVLATSGPEVKKMAADLEAQKDNDLYKAQQTVKSNTATLKSTIAQYGAKSQEARDAAAALQNAQVEAARIAHGGKDASAGVLKTILPESMGGLPKQATTSELIQQNSPQQPQQQATQPSAQIPDGRIMVRSPNGQIGHIPVSQLNDAIKSGYIQVK